MLDLSEQLQLDEIESVDAQLEGRFKDKFVIQPSLTRALVSFQANKARPVYRWYKYKEAFSASLVEYLLYQYPVKKGRILDPFAGSGTALFAAVEAGLNADGIELLPIGQQIINSKKTLESEFAPEDFRTLRTWADSRVWEQSPNRIALHELRITKGAYSTATVDAIERYMGAYQNENVQVRAVLHFALMCVLEAVSYTRKDGQYLRWDYRSGRTQGEKRFDKGEIPTFRRAISEKINEILDDLTMKQLGLFPDETQPGNIRLFDDSCLNILPSLATGSYDAIITSPPYCNRYDYTRTYALELALLGVDEKALTHLRQTMLSCTVENRAKDLLSMNPEWSTPVTAADHQQLLQLILGYLDSQKAEGTLNNNGIPRMVRGYFYEMACVIYECARVMKPGAPLFMVNDNVRYAGVSISVDLILSDFAEKLGFHLENILVLPNGKGNSSQQMGKHGRDPLRKCVYVWRKNEAL